jgi:hypothetical protein
MGKALYAILVAIALSALPARLLPQVATGMIAGGGGQCESHRFLYQLGLCR